MKYRKKSIIVDAIQWFPNIIIEGLCIGQCGDFMCDYYHPSIHLERGTIKINQGDYIVTGIGGCKYPIDLITFHQLYDPVENEDQTN